MLPFNPFHEPLSVRPTSCCFCCLDLCEANHIIVRQQPLMLLLKVVLFLHGTQFSKHRLPRRTSTKTRGRQTALGRKTQLIVHLQYRVMPIWAIVSDGGSTQGNPDSLQHVQFTLSLTGDHGAAITLDS